MKRPRKILVGSVFIDDTKIQQDWFDLQLKYLKETTEEFEHVVCMIGAKSTDYFDKRTNVQIPKRARRNTHMAGLNTLIEYFKTRRDEFDAFLIIDSDAFPIKRGWANKLLTRMVKIDKEIAVPIRYENLETRAHASVLYVLPRALSFLYFEVAVVGHDLLGGGEADVCMPEYEGRRRHMVFPLLRSNQHNIDLVYSAIYYDMFYHHGCGSRKTSSPYRRKLYWSDAIDNDTENLRVELFKNPTEFIDKLAGWSLGSYATVEKVLEEDQEDS